MVAVVWDAVRNACPDDIACARETNDHAALLGICLLLAAAFFAYEKYRGRLPAAGRAVANEVAQVLLVIWSIALLLAAISVNSSIPVAKVQALKSPLPAFIGELQHAALSVRHAYITVPIHLSQGQR